jgi:hypothetical protein
MTVESKVERMYGPCTTGGIDMFTHRLVKHSWVSHEIQKDGAVKTILHVLPAVPSVPGSPLETALAEAIVEYMRQHDEIDRADVV